MGTLTSVGPSGLSALASRNISVKPAPSFARNSSINVNWSVNNRILLQCKAVCGDLRCTSEIYQINFYGTKMLSIIRHGF